MWHFGWSICLEKHFINTDHLPFYMNAWAQFHGNSSSGSWDISLSTEYINLISMEKVRKSPKSWGYHRNHWWHQSYKGAHGDFKTPYTNISSITCWIIATHIQTEWNIEFIISTYHSTPPDEIALYCITLHMSWKMSVAVNGNVHLNYQENLWPPLLFVKAVKFGFPIYFDVFI